MANVTSDLKKIFSCEDLEEKCFSKGMTGYLEGLKKSIENFLKQNEKMQIKDSKKSDTYNNLKNFADILNNSNVYQICGTAQLLPKCVLNKKGKKIRNISLKASIKKVSKDIEKWVEKLKSTNSKLKIINDLLTIKEAIELEKNPNNCLRIDGKKWEEISSNFKKSGIKELKGIAYQIDDDITGKSIVSQSVLYKNWRENKTIEKLIDKIKT